MLYKQLQNPLIRSEFCLESILVFFFILCCFIFLKNHPGLCKEVQLSLVLPGRHRKIEWQKHWHSFQFWFPKVKKKKSGKPYLPSVNCKVNIALKVFPYYRFSYWRREQHGWEERWGLKVSFWNFPKAHITLNVQEPQAPSRTSVMTTFMPTCDFFATLDHFRWPEDDATLWERPAYKCVQAGQCLLTLICGSEGQVR